MPWAKAILRKSKMTALAVCYWFVSLPKFYFTNSGTKTGQSSGNEKYHRMR
jgi:hypothetical protein